MPCLDRRHVADRSGASTSAVRRIHMLRAAIEIDDRVWLRIAAAGDEGEDVDEDKELPDDDEDDEDEEDDLDEDDDDEDDDEEEDDDDEDEDGGDEGAVV
jgi:hypothetical protein